MTVVQIIYGTAPYCLWLCVLGLATAIAVASGSRLPMWPALAALAVGIVSALTDRLGLTGEVAMFCVLSLAFLGLVLLRAPPRASRVEAERLPTYTPNAERPTSPARLVGRIARTSGEFANGVGRVWIDGSEWAAELEAADSLPPNRPVRVTRVIGGVRLQVHPLAA